MGFLFILGFGVQGVGSVEFFQLVFLYFYLLFFQRSMMVAAPTSLFLLYFLCL